LDGWYSHWLLGAVQPCVRVVARKASAHTFEGQETVPLPSCRHGRARDGIADLKVVILAILLLHNLDQRFQHSILLRAYDHLQHHSY